jgi:alpha,alpha-trehalase
MNAKTAVLISALILITSPLQSNAQTLTSGKMMNKNEASKLLKDLSLEFDRLKGKSIRPAEGYIKHDYLIPAGFYKQMWDWDGFFIGCHLASRNKEDAKYLKWWVLNFVQSSDSDGYVPGCITTKGPRPIFGKFAMKPFLSQGAYFASKAMNDFSWLESEYDGLKRVLAYREKTQFDSKYGLFFWDIAVQSGADNNPALTNDENDRSAILAADINAFQLREYISMSKIAKKLGRNDDVRLFTVKASELRNAIMKYLWFKEDASFFNIRRDSGKPIKRVSYSNFVPLIQDLLPRKDGRAMIKKYLWNKDHMLADYGLRSLSKQDSLYNNACIIVPYSNWQGPVWPVANFLYSIALKKYGFEQEAKQLAAVLGTMLLKDIRTCGSMHECYHADTGAPLAPTAEQSEGGVFTGFVGWNLLVQNMLEGAVEDRWLLLEL